LVTAIPIAFYTTTSKQVNNCDSGYDHGWNKYCHIGLARHLNDAAACPGISDPKAEIESLNTIGRLPRPEGN